MAREAGFKAVVTGQGAAVVALAKRFRPDAITLDIGLPDMDGYALLDLLKRNPETRHIPVHIISADEQRRLGLTIGAYGYSGKPIERDTILATFDRVRKFGERSKRLLIVETASSHSSLARLFGAGDVESTIVSSIADAKERLEGGGFDCLVL